MGNIILVDIKMKKIVCCFLLIANIISGYAQKYIAVDYGKWAHYVIDDKVNVRSAPSLSGEKLFQLNAGDKVEILEWDKDWDWLLAEGYYAPWYKISCIKGIGYICGRYLSCKETVGDLDNDGEDEIFACLCISERKGEAISDHPSFYTVNEHHVLIKKSHIIHIDLKKFYKVPISEDTSYSIVECEDLAPKITFLVARSGFGDSSVGGDGWSKARYFYFSNDTLKYFTTLTNSWAETLYETVEKFEFNGNRVKHINTYIRWKHGRETAHKIKVIQYLWNGKDFVKIESETLDTP